MGTLIIEGVDGSGKTTLAYQLAHHYGAKVFHTGPPCGDPFMEYVVDTVRYHYHPRVVLDRFHLGTLVYGTEFRGQPDLSDGEWDALEALLGKLGAALILTTTSKEQIVENLKKKHEDVGASEYEALDTISRVESLFHFAYEKSKLPKFKYDPFRPAPHTLFNTVEALLGWS